MSLSHDSDLSERVIGLAIEVHRHLGPGLLESAYEECLCFELKQTGIDYRRQVSLPKTWSQQISAKAARSAGLPTSARQGTSR